MDFVAIAVASFSVLVSGVDGLPPTHREPKRVRGTQTLLRTVALMNESASGGDLVGEGRMCPRCGQPLSMRARRVDGEGNPVSWAQIVIFLALAGLSLLALPVAVFPEGMEWGVYGGVLMIGLFGWLGVAMLLGAVTGRTQHRALCPACDYVADWRDPSALQEQTAAEPQSASSAPDDAGVQPRRPGQRPVVIGLLAVVLILAAVVLVMVSREPSMPVTAGQVAKITTGQSRSAVEDVLGSAGSRKAPTDVAASLGAGVVGDDIRYWGTEEGWLLVAFTGDEVVGMVTSVTLQSEAPGSVSAPPLTQESGQESFDPSAAPRVPPGQTPEAYVNDYCEFIDSGEFETALMMLPADARAEHEGPERLGQWVQAYGFEGYSVETQLESGSVVTVVSVHPTKAGTLKYTWTFEQDTNGTWLVKARKAATE